MRKKLEEEKVKENSLLGKSSNEVVQLSDKPGKNSSHSNEKAVHCKDRKSVV